MDEGPIVPTACLSCPDGTPGGLRRPAVDFQSDVSYHPLFWLITVVPASTLLCIWLVSEDKAISARGKYAATQVLLWVTIVLILLFLMVLPRKYEVLSDATVSVGSYVATKWKFDDVCAAYDHQNYWSVHAFDVLKLACDGEDCVLVKRKNGAWDLLLSPKDPEAFVRAIWQALANQEARDNHQPELGGQL